MLNVRRAEERDVPAVLDLLMQVNMVHHSARPDLFRGPTTKYSPEELRALFADDGSPVFVCEDGTGRVVGHAFCVLHQRKGDRLLTDIRTLYIDDICVDESARRLGVGRALYDRAVAHARVLGCYNVTLNVWECNPGAKRFYEAMGMSVQKTGMEVIL